MKFVLTIAIALLLSACAPKATDISATSISNSPDVDSTTVQHTRLGTVRGFEVSRIEDGDIVCYHSVSPYVHSGVASAISCVKK